jgi:hypothetical protein
MSITLDDPINQLKRTIAEMETQRAVLGDGVVEAALVGRNEPGDLERAWETYQQSLDMFTEMGAPGYIQVLEERLKDM